MDLGNAQIFLLLTLALSCQVTAIALRKLFLSLFFSFIFSLFIAVILLELGSQTVAMASLWLMTGISHFAILMTFLLIGSHNGQKPERQLSLGFFIYMAVIICVVYKAGGLFDLTSIRVPNHPHYDGDGIHYLLLAIVGLVSFIGSLILVRRDDVKD